MRKLDYEIRKFENVFVKGEHLSASSYLVLEESRLAISNSPSLLDSKTALKNHAGLR